MRTRCSKIEADNPIPSVVVVVAARIVVVIGTEIATESAVVIATESAAVIATDIATNIAPFLIKNNNTASLATQSHDFPIS